jgi:hypothetical protein
LVELDTQLLQVGHAFMPYSCQTALSTAACLLHVGLLYPVILFVVDGM